jgi:hypothetical protein
MGVLGNPDTVVLSGGSRLDYDAFSGARFAAGFWFDRGCSFGLDGSGFFLEKRPADFATGSSTAGTPTLARPIFEAQFGQEGAVIVSSPGGAPGINSLAGTIAVLSNSSLYGWDLNLIDRVNGSGPWHIDLLAGFRYLHLDENVDVVQDSVVLPGGGAFFTGVLQPAGTGLAIFDHFSAVNDFYGGQLGSRVEYSGEHWFVSVLGKIALAIAMRWSMSRAPLRRSRPASPRRPCRVACSPCRATAAASRTTNLPWCPRLASISAASSIGCFALTWVTTSCTGVTWLGRAIRLTER